VPLFRSSKMQKVGGWLKKSCVFHCERKGAAGWVHGGIIAAVCDMFLARSSLILFGSSVTRNMKVHFRAPVPLLAVCALHLLTESNEGMVKARGIDEDGVCLFECEGAFVPRSKL
jgi:acyl-coenzyme A thioesterase PaaI-like protein